MKNIITIVTLLLITGVTHAQDKEKRIKFNKGTLKICSNSHMTIKGYDGDEVVIKSLDQSGFSYYYSFDNKDGSLIKRERSLDSLEESSGQSFYLLSSKYKDAELEKGLKPLGNKSTNPADNLYLNIIEKPGELIIKDYDYSVSDKSKVDGYSYFVKDKKGKSKKDVTTKLNSFFQANNKYEILIPNSIKLSWNAENCKKKNSNTFFLRTTSEPWTLSDFKGDVEISTSYKSINLTNVDGPVIANTIGGNITVVFDEAPKKLYSLVSNDGYIDVTLPNGVDLNVDATGYRILSNIDFKVLNETIVNGVKGMELQLKSGNTKMKLDAGSGSVYLRKQD
ncbi:hypothetical protein [Winogradskyella sp.]|uniref:hypothetical protein n=1 Tax=Winogradskyella sp. TaxID=1883156 RepID=UPI00260E6BC8|nr:hypothetical protein [Winogradskyella sp.]